MINYEIFILVHISFYHNPSLDPNDENSKILIEYRIFMFQMIINMIWNLCNMAKPFTQLTRIDQKYVWGEAQKKELKVGFKLALILRQPIQGWPF
jgi:hypothetical protein